ncbi:MAG: S9 family peptidase [Methylococcales bacterium]
MECVLADEDIYWIEMRPGENGRYVVVRLGIDGRLCDVTPMPYSARTRAHEYGGASYWVVRETIFFTNFTDQRIYRQELGAEPRPITPEGEYSYADAVIDRVHERLICVREDHTNRDAEAIDTIVSVPLKGDGKQGSTVLIEGKDFYSSPRLSPNGKQLAWISWCHPNMPWDGSQLWVAGVNSDGLPIKPTLIAGGNDESILQPEWSPDSSLYFISDRSGWWNLYRWRNSRIECVITMPAEFGNPPWTFGNSTYAFKHAGCIICTYISDGIDHLASVDTENQLLEDIETPYTSISYIRVSSGRAVFIGGSPTESASIIELDLKTRDWTVLRRSSEVKIDPEYVSIPEAFEFPTENGLTSHAFFYAPKNRNYAGPNDERPPLLVFIHGGPTASCDSTLSLQVQYWTSRGIAVLDVNYGGSSGFGRAYRQRLSGQWGIVDVDDCVNGAIYLAENGLVDNNRLAIRGSSAGGYTTLAALTFRNIFTAGASHYGVSDLESLLRDTHKFESHYLDRLIGPYPAQAEIYRQRSPINFVAQLSCPVIFFQGLEDKIVPPSQAKKMVEALRANKLPVAYLEFEGEQHGFRSATTIERVLDAELYFYSRVFGFYPSDSVEPVSIENIERITPRRAQ